MTTENKNKNNDVDNSSPKKYYFSNFVNTVCAGIVGLGAGLGIYLALSNHVPKAESPVNNPYYVNAGNQVVNNGGNIYNAGDICTTTGCCDTDSSKVVDLTKILVVKEDSVQINHGGE